MRKDLASTPLPLLVLTLVPVLVPTLVPTLVPVLVPTLVPALVPALSGSPAVAIWATKAGTGPGTSRVHAFAAWWTDSICLFIRPPSGQKTRRPEWIDLPSSELNSYNAREFTYRSVLSEPSSPDDSSSAEFDEPSIAEGQFGSEPSEVGPGTM